MSLTDQEQHAYRIFWHWQSINERMHVPPSLQSCPQASMYSICVWWHQQIYLTGEKSIVCARQEKDSLILHTVCDGCGRVLHYAWSAWLQCVKTATASTWNWYVWILDDLMNETKQILKWSRWEEKGPALAPFVALGMSGWSGLRIVGRPAIDVDGPR